MSPPSDLSPSFRPRRAWLALALFAVVFFASRQIATEAIDGRTTTWTAALLDKGSYFASLAVVGLLVVAAARRFERLRPRGVALVAGWVGLALVAAPLFAAVLTLVRAADAGFAPPAAGWLGAWAGHLRGASSTYLVLIVCVLIGDWSFRTYESYVRERVAAARLAQELEREQLAAVSLRLDPDFVLGALATIRARLAEDPAAAEDLLLELSDLLRRVLESDPDGRWPLREELRFAAGYLHLAAASARDGDALPLNIERDAESSEVPTFLLRPWLEVAVEIARRAPALRLEAGVRCESAGGRLTLDLALRPAGGTPLATVSGQRLAVEEIRDRIVARHGAQVRCELPAVTGAFLAVRIALAAEEATAAEHAVTAGPSGEVIWKRA